MPVLTPDTVRSAALARFTDYRRENSDHADSLELYGRTAIRERRRGRCR